MDVSVQHKEEKPLLHREDVVVRVAYEGATPKRTELRDTIAHTLKATADMVIVRRISTIFGKQAAIVNASVYKEKKALEQFEPKHMKKRHGIAVEEAAKPAGGN